MEISQLRHGIHLAVGSQFNRSIFFSMDRGPDIVTVHNSWLRPGWNDLWSGAMLQPPCCSGALLPSLYSYVYSFLLSLSNFREKFTKSVVYLPMSGILCEQWPRGKWQALCTLDWWSLILSKSFISTSSLCSSFRDWWSCKAWSSKQSEEKPVWQASLDPLLGPPEPYDMMSAWPVEARSKVG